MSAFQITPQSESSEKTNNAPHELIFHFGRVTSYALLGSVFASGLWLIDFENMKIFSSALRLLSGILLILAGFYLLGKTQVLKYVEKLGEPIWKVVLPIFKKLLPLDRLDKAFAAGMLWAFLPCGLIYSALLVMLASQSIISTSLGMLCFGLGTIPALIFSNRLVNIIGSNLFKRFSSLFLMAFGLWTLTPVLLPLVLAMLNVLLGTSFGMEHHH